VGLMPILEPNSGICRHASKVRVFGAWIGSPSVQGVCSPNAMPGKFRSAIVRDAMALPDPSGSAVTKPSRSGGFLSHPGYTERAHRASIAYVVDYLTNTAARRTVRVWIKQRNVVSLLDKGKLAVRRGRKAIGPMGNEWAAGLPRSGARLPFVLSTVPRRVVHQVRGKVIAQ
jgi:hypothetical protein